MSLPPSGVFAISFFGWLSVFLYRSVFALLSSVALMSFAYFPAPGFSFYYRSLPLRLLYNYPVFFQTLYGSLLSFCFFSFFAFGSGIFVFSLPTAPLPLLRWLCPVQVPGFRFLLLVLEVPRYFFRCFYVLASSSVGLPRVGSGVHIRLSVAPTLLLPQVVVLFGSCLSPQAASVA